MIYQTWKSPVGRLHLVANEKGLLALAFDDNWKSLRGQIARRQPRAPGASAGDLRRGESPVITQAIAELDEYFRGSRRTFSVPLAVQGTPFQRKAWGALRKIPYGAVSTYAKQAARIQQPTAVRAVGRANGLNPVCILVPCHRVVGSNGSLTGYAGGLKAKKALLALEGIDLG
jgi:methylated-DNA-[protein]-cysteine S-methyltransferase